MLKTRKGYLAIMAIFLFGAMLLSGCASIGMSYHKYVLRGTILEASASDVFLCIGSRDGARAGQTLDVYRLVPKATSQPGKGGKTGTKFLKEKTGAVKITQIVDEHFARADIIRGTVRKDYIAELEYPSDCNCAKCK